MGENFLKTPEVDDGVMMGWWRSLMDLWTHDKLVWLISVILITGGYDGSWLTSVEVFSPSGVRLPCSVPPLLASRYDHTQDGEVACGGGFGDTSCATLTASGWITSHLLTEKRHGHVSWSSPAGLLLMGDWTTELLSDTGSSSTPSFGLEYETL